MKSKASLANQEPARDVKLDPVLLEQLDAVAADATPVEAVITLRPDHPEQIAALPDRAEEMTHQMLRRVESQTGTGADRVNIFRNFGSFAISANRHFIRELLKQPEVASAMANRGTTDAYIKPVDVEPVKPGSSRGWSSSEAEKKTGGSPRAASSSKVKSQKSARAGKSHK
jgi:hypothetical protein